MTEPVEEPKNATLSFKQLRQLIADTVEGAFSSREAQRIDTETQPQSGRRQLRQPAGTQQPGRTVVDEEVQKALEKLEREKEERARAEALRTDIDDLKADKKKREERAPIERRRVHKIMRWGEND